MCRKRSGGVPGIEYGMKGVVGRVLLRDAPMNASVAFIGGPSLLADSWGNCCCCVCCGSSREGVMAGDCGLERSYDICGAGGPFE